MGDAPKSKPTDEDYTNVKPLNTQYADIHNLFESLKDTALEHRGTAVMGVMCHADGGVSSFYCSPGNRQNYYQELGAAEALKDYIKQKYQPEEE